MPKSPRAQEPKSPKAQEPRSPEPKSRAQEVKSPRAQKPKRPRAQEPKSPRAQEPKSPSAKGAMYCYTVVNTVARILGDFSYFPIFPFPTFPFFAIHTLVVKGEKAASRMHRKLSLFSPTTTDSLPPRPWGPQFI
jgi:hypothetical protein